MNIFKSKYFIILVVVAIILLVIYFFLNRNLPQVSPSLSGTGSLVVSEEGVTIDLENCAPDIRLIDVERNPTIIEVVKKSFGVCLVNYGTAMHKRNLIQPLPNRCEIPWEGRPSVTLPIYAKLRLDLSSIQQYCNLGSSATTTQQTP